MNDFIKKPCQHCPFRTDVKPFIHPRRAEEISSAASNPYNSFTCHKTIGGDEKQCAGFLTMQANENGKTLYEGFEPADNVYQDSWEMTEAYKQAWAEGES